MIPKLLLLLLPHMHDHFGGRVRARCCKPFENSFVTTTYGIIEDGFQAQSLHYKLGKGKFVPCTKVGEMQQQHQQQRAMLFFFENNEWSVFPK